MKRIFFYFSKLFLIPIAERFFIKEIKGKENLPQNNFILAANHLSGWDHVFIIAALKEKLNDLRFVGAMDSLKLFFQSGLMYYLTEAIIIHRKKTKREEFLEKVNKVIKKNKIVVIYPEGGTNPKNYLLKGKTGVAGIVLEADLPVVPLGIRKVPLSKKIIISIGKPIYFSEEVAKARKLNKNQEEYPKFLRQITDKIMSQISKLSQKPYAN